MLIMGIITSIIKVLNTVWNGVNFLYDYRTFFKITGVFLTRKFPKAKTQHKYAILVAARNEETVIGQLVESIRAQDYPSELVTIFVVADNCTDNTAAVARDYGAICYERFDNEHRTKGFALQFLVECIRKDYGIDAFEGYFIFDADNLLKRDYISNMNDSFDAGEKIVTSYRNTKNFDDNWISASYGIHWLRTVRNEHRPRSFFHLATRIQGTGFLFAHEVIKDGWNYTSLTEDRAFCADAVAQGYKISYNNEAEFYDEQPVDIKIAMRQRIRWAKGRMACFFRYCFKLFYGLVKFFKPGKRPTSPKIKVFHYEKGTFATLPFHKKLLFIWERVMDICSFVVDIFAIPFRFIAKNFTNFDMIFYLFPVSFFKRMVWIAEFLIGWQIGKMITEGKGLLPIAVAVISLLCGSLTTYISNILSGLVVVIREWKHIHCPNKFKLAFYLITWPLHDMIYPYICLASLFMHVTWKPIKHDVVKTLDDIEGKK